MKRLLYIFLVLLLVGGFGCSKKKHGIPNAFGLTVDSLILEGTVSDNLDLAPTVSIEGNSANIDAGSFIETISTTDKDTFSIESEDKVPNKTTIVIDIR